MDITVNLRHGQRPDTPTGWRDQLRARWNASDWIVRTVAVIYLVLIVLFAFAQSWLSIVSLTAFMFVYIEWNYWRTVATNALTLAQFGFLIAADLNAADENGHHRMYYAKYGDAWRPCLPKDDDE